MVDFHNEMTGENLAFDEMFQEPFVATDEYCNGDWGDYYPAVREAKGKTIIEGAGDNTIPYAMWEYIEECFNGTRCHFG